MLVTGPWGSRLPQKVVVNWSVVLNSNQVAAAVAAAAGLSWS